MFSTESMFSTEGIVIKETDSGEADRFFTIFTKDFGKIKVMARGLRKIKAKLRSGLQLLNRIYLEFVKGKYFYTATEAVKIEGFKNLKNDFKKLRAGFYLSSLLDKLTEEETNERIWFLFLKILKKMERPEFSGPKLNLLLRYFEWNLISILGFEPELYHCPGCETKLKIGKLYFSASEGGILCQNCKRRDPTAKEISPEAVKVLRLILGRKKEILEKLKIGSEENQLKKSFKYYLEYILEEKIDVV